jgi:hypothetical protein
MAKSKKSTPKSREEELKIAYLEEAIYESSRGNWTYYGYYGSKSKENLKKGYAIEQNIVNRRNAIQQNYFKKMEKKIFDNALALKGLKAYVNYIATELKNDTKQLIASAEKKEGIKYNKKEDRWWMEGIWSQRNISRASIQKAKAKVIEMLLKDIISEYAFEQKKIVKTDSKKKTKTQKEKPKKSKDGEETPKTLEQWQKKIDKNPINWRKYVCDACDDFIQWTLFEPDSRVVIADYNKSGKKYQNEDVRAFNVDSFSDQLPEDFDIDNDYETLCNDCFNEFAEEPLGRETEEEENEEEEKEEGFGKKHGVLEEEPIEEEEKEEE